MVMYSAMKPEGGGKFDLVDPSEVEEEEQDAVTDLVIGVDVICG